MFCIWGKTSLQIQEAQLSPSSIFFLNYKNTPRHIIGKLMKTRVKENILKVDRKKDTLPEATPLRATAGFSKETNKIRGHWQDIF